MRICTLMQIEIFLMKLLRRRDVYNIEIWHVLSRSAARCSFPLVLKGYLKIRIRIA